MTATPAQAYASPLLDLDGAVNADPPDTGVAAHYGEPLREQRRLAHDHTGFVDLSHRGVVRVTGPDRLTWLHSLSTQDLEHLVAGESTSALLLSPHGHVEHTLAGVDDGEAFWMHVEPGTSAALVAFLDSMRFLLRVEVADLTSEYAIVWEPRSEVATGHLTRMGVDSLGGREVFVPRARLRAYAEEAGAPAGMWAYEALRIAAHVPRLGFETDHRTIPNEVGWLGSAVHLDKGCYRGQETVARVYNLGRPPRRLVFLHLDGSVDRLPAHGAVVTQDGKDVGFVTSSARHHELGPVAMALVRRNVPPEATLLADGVAAAQEVIVPPDAGLHVRAQLRR
ncbi:YgfZ/GcvT domain-containing protein [Actinopolymorpha alba]|uniref:CAF17-like 4Fe-4S cluster assembly/insertion protein YgfZ n=1 Tax=Actinopolymorpha alba TaxID=533267 RepID=UPI000379903F|nr:glycine cleavage T C-terminal barrel domain-containing protein [Actinopolymorpha alba]